MILLVFFSFFILCQCHAPLNSNAYDSKRFTIQFKSPMNDAKAIEQDKERFLQYMQKHHAMETIQIRYNYTNVLNGMSIELIPRTSTLSAATITNHSDDFVKNTLATCPYVKRYWPGKRYARPNTIRQQYIDDVRMDPSLFPLDNYTIPLLVDTGTPNLQIAHEWTTVNKAKEMGWTGKGVRIGILDTGVDYTHPALGGCFGEGCLVRWGADLVGDRYADGSGSGLIPDDDPIDQCDGHGTHIAGIIAANDKFKGFEGVAPGVTLGAWRIFACDGDTDDDIIIAAADMAVKAGMDIINLSLGGGTSSWQEDPLAVALSNIADKNITVVVAQGNEGEDGVARTPSPAIGKHVISVGSIDNGERFGPTIEILNNELELKGTYEYSMATAGTRKRFATSGFNTSFTAVDELDVCNNTFGQNITGKIAVVYQGSACSSTEKALNLQDAGVAVASMSFNEGTSLVKLLKESPQQPNIHFTASKIQVKSAGQPSSFSTFGPDPELHFKPDISAVGGFVYSTFPVNLGAYATMSGTSMATPYVAGCIALMMQASEDRNSAVILDRLTNYAKPIEKETALMETPIKQGSGLVQIYDSIMGDHFITPSKLSLNDTMYHLNSAYITVLNKSNTSKLFTFDSVPSIGVQGYNFSLSAVPLITPKYQVSQANITFDKNSIELSANESIRLLVQIEQPDRSAIMNHTIYGGYLKIMSKPVDDAMEDENLSYVPFFGTVGNQKDLPILDTKTGYPYIGDSAGRKISANAYTAYRFPKSAKIAEVPEEAMYIYTRFGSPTAHVQFQLLNGEQVVGILPPGVQDYISRNDHSYGNYDYVLAWQGDMIPVPQSANNGCDGWMSSEYEVGDNLTHVPSGFYTVRACVLKIFGNSGTAKDWDTWISPLFEVIG